MTFLGLVGRCALALWIALLAGCGQGLVEGPRAVAGKIDLREWDFGRHGIAPLDGQWQLQWDEFADPRQTAPASAPLAQVPGPWNALGAGAFGRGTYHLTVECRRGSGLALSLPVQHSAAQWFVNGALVARQGEPGASQRGAQPAPIQQTVALGSTACPLHIVAHVSNFDMRRGGLLRSVELGEVRQLAERREMALMRDLLTIGGLMVLGVMPLIFFLGLRRDTSPLYFGLFCLLFALVMGLTGTRVLQAVMAPLGWDRYLQLVFFGWYGVNVLFTLFLRSLYPQQVSRSAVRLIAGWGLLSVLTVFATDSRTYTRLLPTLAAGAALASLYVGWRLVAAIRSGRRTARLLLAGLVALVAAVVHDSIRYEQLMRLTLVPYGVLLFVSAPAYLMARRFARAFKVEERLAIEQRERADLLVRSTNAGLLDWDAISGRVDWSMRMREMLGYPTGPGQPEVPAIRGLLHPDDRDSVLESLRRQLRDRSVRSGVRVSEPIDYRLRRSDGEYLWVHAEAVAVCDANGRTLRYICSFIDVTPQRAQERALRESHDQIAAQAAQLEQQNEALKENVRLREEVERIGRHDIKTPLNSIVSVPRLLREERRLGPEADELLDIVERAGYRILSMVNLSLDLFKIEQGSYIFRPDAVDLADLVDKVLADVRLHAASKGIHFDVDLDGAAYAWAEELLCYSLLANLVKNAVEASPEGEPVTIRASNQTEGSVTVDIHNRGEVPAAIRGSFFQKYATLGKASGTGLGTYSARLMARVQDGEIAMKTSAAGTTLSVTLRAAAPGVTPATVRHVAELAGGTRLQIASLPPRRVLLVDDDEYNLLIVRRFLPSPPFAVETAINGRVALATAQRTWPDVLFMDLDMPVMGGMEAVQKLRAMEQATRAKRCTMIALSSHEDAQTQAAALQAGFDHYLTKPVTRDRIHETLLNLERFGPQGAGGGVLPPAAAPSPSATPVDPVLIDVDMRASLQEYRASRRALVAALAPALEAGDRGELRRLAHQLAGSLALYGFRWASEQCRWVEQHHAEVDEASVRKLADAVHLHLQNADIHFVSIDDGLAAVT